MEKIQGIGLTGFMKAGKNTFANYLEEEILKWKGSNYIVEQCALAGALKSFCIEYLGLTKHQVYDQEGKAEYNEFWGMTNREILQRIGTEAMRVGFHGDVWVKILELKIRNYVEDGKFFIVTDVRFPNEANMIHRHGGIVVKIDRPSVTPKDLTNIHKSEAPLSAQYIDYVVSNHLDLSHLQKEAGVLKGMIRSRNQYVDTINGSVPTTIIE